MNRFSVVLIPLLFFIIGLTTLSDYGINWDSPIHFARGQAYLRYILTGKTNYEGEPTYCRSVDNVSSQIDYETGEICDRHRKVRVSEYESDLLNFDSWVAQATYGHPAFSGIMLAVSNNIFFKTLGWVEDIDSYHLYILFTTFLLALAVSFWAKQTFGIFAAIASTLAIYSFPLLFAESHFNVKDLPMASFFTISVYFFWLALIKKKPLYLIFSALAGGASFGTKLNFVFAPFILFPWLVVYLISQKSSLTKIFSKKMLLAVFAYPLIVFLVFFLTWPALWSDPVNNIFGVFHFYQDIGGSKCSYFYFTPSWFTQCTQLTTVKYLLYTLPPFTIFLFFIGFVVSIIKIKEKSYVTLLWLTFIIFTILRVTLSLTSVYGGLRQILEFVAPLALISGVGALFLRNLLVTISIKVFKLKKSNKKFIVLVASSVILLGYVPIFLQIIKIHPNQNVYFNFLIGGLKGAAAKDFPGYGNTYGSAYLQGIKWLNQNAEPNSKLALVSGNAQNIPRGIIRGDISFFNGYRSAYNQDGEYQILLISGQDPLSETFRYKYVNTFLDNVYTIDIDGVPLLKIWKNDKNHLESEVNFDSQKEERPNIKFAKEKNREAIIIDLDENKNLKGLGFTFPNQECKKSMIGTTIYISENGSSYTQKAEGVDNFAETEIQGFNADFVYLFPGDEAKYIKIIPPVDYPCRLTEVDFSVFTFKKLYNNLK